MGIKEVHTILEDIKKEENRRLAGRILEMQQNQRRCYLEKIRNDDNNRLDEIVNEFLDENEISFREQMVLEKFIAFYKGK